jgi:hypothetical protein
VIVSVSSPVAICAYTSVGVAFATITRSDQRLVFWLLITYWVVVFLWETVGRRRLTREMAV